MTLRIRSSPGELEIEGSAAAFKLLQNTLNVFVSETNAASLNIAVEREFDPSPYLVGLQHFEIERGDGDNCFSVSETTLRLVGSPASLKDFANNLPVEAKLDDGYHVHYDHITNSVTSDSPELVLAVRSA